jgi:hypothetical protein
MIKSSSDANGGRCRMREFEAHRHELRASGIVVIMIMFHIDDLFGGDGLPDLRHMDVARMAENAKDRQQPHDDTNHDDDVENFFNLPVHRDVGIDQPEQHANDNQSDGDSNQWHGLAWVEVDELIFMLRD